MIYGTTSRQAFSRQLRRCVAQQGPTVGVVRPGGGMNRWERSSLPSGKLSRHGRLVKALEHHTMLKPVLSSRHLSFKTRGHVYSTCVRSAMLHASETWPVTKPCLQRLQRNDRAMIRQICNVKPQDTATIRSIELLARLGIEDLDIILKERRLRWYGHVERSNGAVKTAFDIQVMESVGLGGPR